MKTILILLSLAVSISAINYTLFKQCDSQWGNNKLGTSSNTICSAGCLMSCSAMMLNTYGVEINGSKANPGTLNSWLTGHGGYVQGDLYVWASVDTFGFNFAGFISNGNVISTFNSGKTLMLNVRSGSHWVLMTGYSGSTIYVNDPGFSVTSYPLSGVGQVGAYSRTKSIEGYLDWFFFEFERFIEQIETLFI